MKLHFARLGMMGLVLSVLASTATVAFAAPSTQHLMKVTTDAVDNFDYRFEVTLDDQGDMTGFNYFPVGGTVTHVSIEKMRTTKTVVIRNEERKLDVVTFIAPQVDAQHGGDIKVTYLYNGIRKTYRQFTFEIFRSGATWGLRTKEAYTRRGYYLESRPFTEMFLKANKLFGQVIGINYISVE